MDPHQLRCFAAAAEEPHHVRLKASDMNKLPLAAGWTRGTGAPIRENMLEMLKAHLSCYAREASFKKTDP